MLNEATFESHAFTGADDTFSALFHSARYPTFFIDFRKTPNPLLRRRNRITNFYSNWQTPKPLPIASGGNFDGLFSFAIRRQQKHMQVIKRERFIDELKP